MAAWLSKTRDCVAASGASEPGEHRVQDGLLVHSDPAGRHGRSEGWVPARGHGWSVERRAVGADGAEVVGHAHQPGLTPHCRDEPVGHRDTWPVEVAVIAQGRPGCSEPVQQRGRHEAGHPRRTQHRDQAAAALGHRFKQLQNVGGAQEDSDCLLAPEWEQLFYDKVAEMLKKL